MAIKQNFKKTHTSETTFYSMNISMVNLLTNGGPGSTTEVVSITLKREAFEKWRTGYSSALAIILFVAVFGLANIYVKALNAVKNR